MNLCDFLQLCKYYVGIICRKGQEGQNVKAHYELGNDPLKFMCFKQRTRMKVDDRIEILKLCFFHINSDFL